MKWLDRLAGSTWFAYVSIFLLQSRLLWGIWEHRDLSGGDTANYFHYASEWAHSFQVDSVFYPLYTVPWGSLQWIFSDPYPVTIVFRILVAIGGSLMVLAVLRGLLSPGIAWVLAVWWTVNPINYDNLYEVHLYALITSLVAVVLACRWKGLRMRAAVFAVLLVNTVFMRGETLFALVAWTAIVVAYELRLRRAGRGTPRGSLQRAFGIPLLVVVVAAAVAVGADRNRAHVIQRFTDKQAVNACENYAFGYEQRHSDYRRDPFSGCGPLAQRQFGTALPTWADAVTSNPRAVAGHFLWNTELVPQGLQLMLFDGISGGSNHDPDYIPVHTHSTWSLVGLIAVIVFVAGGLVLLWRDRRRWWLTWVRERVWGWLALIALATTAVITMIWERPRPAYVFALTVLIMAGVGLCAMAYADRWPRLRQARAGIPIVALLLLLVIPGHYGSAYLTPQVGRPGRPMKDMLDRLYPMRDRLHGDEVKLLATYGGAVCIYLDGADPCKPINWKPIVSRDPDVSVDAALSRRAVDFIYVDQQDLEDPAIRTATQQAEAAGWSPAPISTDQSWVLLRRG
jgi:hypothetical protein